MCGGHIQEQQSASRLSQAILTTMTSTSHTVGFVINYTEDSPCLEKKMTFSGFRAKLGHQTPVCKGLDKTWCWVIPVLKRQG